MVGKKTRDSLLSSDPEYYSKLSKKRKVNVGGQTFKDPETASRAAKARWKKYYANRKEQDA